MVRGVKDSFFIFQLKKEKPRVAGLSDSGHAD